MILALPSWLGFPAAALWMSTILMVINLTSGFFLLALARQVATHKLLRISLITAATVFGFWLAFGLLSALLYITVRNYNIPDWLGLILYVTAEIIAPVVLLAAIIGIIVSTIIIIINGIKTRRVLLTK